MDVNNGFLKAVSSYKKKKSVFSIEKKRTDLSFLYSALIKSYLCL